MNPRLFFDQLKSEYFTAEAKNSLEYQKRRGWTVVTTNGCFDLMHAGHVLFLSSCLKYSGIPEKSILIVLVNDDNSVKTIKDSERPVYPESHRLYMVRALRSVTAAFLFGDRTPKRILSRIEPDFHFKGIEWKDREIPEKPYVGKMLFLQHFIDVSTSSTIEDIRRKYNPERGKDG